MPGTSPYRELPPHDVVDWVTTASGRPAAAAAPAHLAGRDIAGLLFVADMYGVQLDQLAAVLGVSEPGPGPSPLRGGGPGTPSRPGSGRARRGSG